MNDNEREKINISIDEDSPDAQFQEDVEELQAVKLNKRITRMSFLIVSLMVVFILFAYIDLKKNLSMMSTSGNTEIETLSKDMQSKFSSLLLQQAKFEEVFAKKIIPLEKDVGSLQTNLKEISTATKQIRSAINNDNKKTKDAIETIHETLAPVPKKFEQLASDIDQFKEKYANELASLARTTTNIQGQIQQLQSDIETLSSSQLDKKKLAIELLNERSIYQKKLIQFKSDMDNRLIAIEKKIKGLVEQQQTVKSKLAPSSQSQDLKPVGEHTQPQSGSIIEQDIQYHGQGNSTSNPE
jgi:predicted  nucleic acid-binding Zn-ribbon protein